MNILRKLRALFRQEKLDAEMAGEMRAQANQMPQSVLKLLQG